MKRVSQHAPKSSAASPPADSISRHLGSRVKHLRSARGWSLETLANASGVSRSMLSQIEREQANPTLAVTLRIARAAYPMNRSRSGNAGPSRCEMFR